MKKSIIPFLAFIIVACAGQLSAGNWVEYDPEPENENLIDTGSFLGLIDISNDPFIWSFKMHQFMYVPEGSRTEHGGWVRISRRDSALYFPDHEDDSDD